MEHPYGEQYGQEGNPRAYMTMRDYRNLPYQWQNQQPWERNPNPTRSMREYRDQWMSAPVYSVPSTYPPPPQYDHPEPPFYASTPQSPQSQQPPPLSLVEQAILNLSKQVDNFIEDNRVVNVQANRKIETLKSSLNKRTDGLQSEMELKLDNLQCSILKLSQQLDHAEEESQEDECLTEPILGEQVQLQPQEELNVESVEAPEELQDAPESSVNFWPWTKEEQTSALISEEESQEEECLSDTMVEEQCQQHLLLEPSDIGATVCPWENHTALLSEESSGHETGEEPQEPIFQPIPMKMNPSATAQPNNNPTANAKTTYSPLPVYILPTSTENPKPATPAPKARSNPSLHAMKNLKILVAYVHKFATTSKAQAAAYMAWHSGWFWCGFGFGASEPRHF